MNAILIAIVLLVCASASPQAQEPSLKEAEARLAAINALARGHYARARDSVLADGPVIVIEAEAATLLHNGTSERVAYLPARYRHFKALGHVALGLWALVEPRLGQPVDTALGAALTAYRAELDGLLPHVGALGLRWDDASRQREILTASIAYIDAALKAERATVEARAEWADAVGPALLGNAYDAAEAQLGALHTLVERWRTGLPPDDWAKLRVVVLGPNRPREAHPPLAYFQRRLGEAARGSHLFSADNVTTSEGGLEILAAAISDRRLAYDFFRNSERLSRGLLMDATIRHLDRLLGP
ncbi:MAG: hypothetical protein FJX55_13965 [Alphaproteobacteria bacterium]|nr:hypothetical protein [Alphaproteobacteria bacterium]